jgi:hypothetical protein
MGQYSLNLAFRFLLEISALISLGLWSWYLTSSGWRYFLVLSIPLLFVSAWGMFNVPGDPSRSGDAPIVVSGALRLCLELTIFVLATLSLYQLGCLKLSWIFGLAVIIHYLISYDRIIWLMAK